MVTRLVLVVLTALLALAPVLGADDRVGWADDGSTATGWTDNVWPGCTGAASITTDGQRVTFTTLNGSFMVGASAAWAPDWPDWDKNVAPGLAMIVRKYPDVVDLDRYHYLVARMTHAGTYVALALNGTDTKVCYTTGLHAVDLRDLASDRLRGRQPVELRLTMLNTEAKVVFDEVRLVSELTPDEQAGLVPAGHRLRLARLEPRPYHGLEALNARCGRPVRFDVPNEGATFRDTSTGAAVRRLTGTVRNEYCDSFSPTGSALPIYNRAMRWSSLYDFARARVRDLTDLRGAAVYSRAHPSRIYLLSSQAEGGRARYQIVAHDFETSTTTPVADWLSDDGGQSEFGASPYSERLILGLKEGRALYLIDPTAPADQRVRRVPLGMRMKGSYLTHGDQSVTWQRCYYFQRWRMDLATGAVTPGGYPTYGGHEVFGRDVIVGRYGTMLLAHRLGIAPLDEADSGEIRIFANWAEPVPSDYGQLASDDRWLVTNGVEGAVAGKRLLVDGRESGTVLQIVHDFTSRGGWDANTYSRISPDTTKLAYNCDMLGDTDVYYAVTRRPLPPRSLRIERGAGAARLTWQAPAAAIEVRGYNVYRTTDSGRAYRRINRELVQGLAYTDPDPPAAACYAVAAEEHSGLEGIYSEEATLAPMGTRRLSAELEDAELMPPMRQHFDGDSVGYRCVRLWRTTPQESTGRARVSLAVASDGDYTLWLRARGTGSLLVRSAGTASALSIDSPQWSWQRLPARLPLSAGQRELDLASSSDGLCLDRVVLSNAVEPPARPDDRDPTPAAVKALRTTEVAASAVRLAWDASADPDLDEYSVYVGDRADFEPGNATLLCSGRQPEALDWGFAPGATLYYKVVAVNKRGLASPPAVLRVVTPTLPLATLELPIASATLSGGLERTESKGAMAAWLPVALADDAPRPAVTWRFTAPEDGTYYVWARYATYDAKKVSLYFIESSGDPRLNGSNWRLRMPNTLTRHLSGVKPGEETWFTDKALSGWWAGPIDHLQLRRGEQTLTVGFEPTHAPNGPRLAAVYLSTDPAYRPPGYDPRIDFTK